MFDFSEAESYIYKSKASIKRFTDEFLGDRCQLLTVSWNSAQMIIEYLDRDLVTRHETYAIRLWDEYFEEE